MKIHELKTIQPYFQKVWDGKKTFEVRENDRDFKVGDVLHLRLYLPDSKEYMSESILCKITYILSDKSYVKEGFAILAIKVIERCEW